MSGLRIDSAASRISVDDRRARQTPNNPTSFERVLRGGAEVLLAGAATASRMVGLPSLSAAISRVDVDGDRNLSGASTALGSGSALDMQQTLHQQRLDEDLQLLALQDGIQRHNRQISLMSNVLKSRHDTAKSAIGNMRA
jgi:hypothetical protein